MGLFEAIGRQYRAIWGQLSAGHRVILVLLCAVSAAAVVAVVYWAGQPDYEILYSGLSAKDCSALVGGLKDAGIEARINESGDAVLVPIASMHQARMVGAETGLPSGATAGFEAFKEPKIGMTPFAERVNYLNALQNELAATITSLSSVAYARVHLVVPERALFKKDQQKATASVLVVTRGGHRLSHDKAMGIASLVASAVEGLAPEEVTITDGRGNVLAGAQQDGPEMAAGDQFAHRQRIESYLSSRAESMVARLVGPGNCEVRVAAELKFNDTKEVTRSYDPDKRVVVSERIESTQSSGSATRVGGPAGSASNVPGEQQQATSGSQAPATESKTENIDTEYLVSESQTETVQRGAEIKRLTVAAFIDTSALSGGNEEAEAGGPSIEEITRIVKDAIGLDESRGDTFKIVEAGFHPVSEELAAVGGGAPAWLMPVGKYFAVGMLALVLLFVARRVMKGIESASPRQVVVPEVVGAESSGPPARIDEDELIRREIAKFVRESPEAAGRMLEGWVEGEE